MTSRSFNIQTVRRDFPILSRSVNGHALAYLDNGASTQKPTVVLEAMDRFYRTDNANIHRAVHTLSQQATDLFEQARIKVQRFINAPSKETVIFTRGTTESINLVAHSFTRSHCVAGDEILISTLEHHSNIVPWQIAAEERGLTLKVIPITDAGDLDYDAIPSLLTSRTKLVAVTHTSNALGTLIDVRRVIDFAKRVGAAVLVDGAQWVGHQPLDVQALGCDFYVFSSHKLFGPTGVGVLWGKREHLERMPPYQGGGDMIRTVSFEKTIYADLPSKFEAGTPDIAGVIGLGAAVDYLQTLDRAAAARHEHELLAYTTDQLKAIPGIRILGDVPNKASVISFVLDDPKVDAHTLGTLLDAEGIAVRTGHHCCMPLMDRLGVSGTVRASFSFYNDRDDADRLIAGVRKIRESFLNVKPQVAGAVTADAIPYFARAAHSPEAAAALLIDDFDLFDDWEQKNGYLIDLGKKLRPLPAAAKTEAARVHGCQSTVHLVGRLQPGSADVIEFAAESDAFIVNGLIYLLSMIYSGQQASAVLAFDVESFLEKLGLNHHLSMGRRNGLAGMISRIRRLALANADAVTIAKMKASVS